MAESTIYQLLAQDHREVEEYFSQLKGAKGAQAETIFQKLSQELQRHMRAEEKVFYSVMDKMPEAKELVAEGYKEHREAQQMLSSMSGSPGDAEWMGQVRKIEQAIQHHVQEEENEMFQTTRKSVDEFLAVDLGKEFQNEKKAYNKS